MGLDSFNRCDLVVGNPNDPGAGQRIITVNGRGWDPSDEALLTVQAMIKFTRLLPYAAGRTASGTPTTLSLTNFGEPPDTLLRWLKDRGVSNETMDAHAENRAPSVGRPATFPADAEGYPALNPLMEANARTFATTHGLPWPPAMEGMDALDAVIDARRARADLKEDEESDLEDGDLTVLAGAYAGEVSRREHGGEWELDPRQSTPIVLRTGPDQSVVVNFPGKVVKYLCSGPSDSVRSLVAAVRAHVRDELSRGR